MGVYTGPASAKGLCVEPGRSKENVPDSQLCMSVVRLHHDVWQNHPCMVCCCALAIKLTRSIQFSTQDVRFVMLNGMVYIVFIVVL